MHRLQISSPCPIFAGPPSQSHESCPSWQTGQDNINMATDHVDIWYVGHIRRKFMAYVTSGTRQIYDMGVRKITGILKVMDHSPTF